MKKFLVVFAFTFIALSVAQVALADNDFYGIVESRPDGKIGTWIIGGRSFEVSENTELDEDNGPLKVGTCAEVEIENGVVKEIESESLRKCDK